MTEGPELNTTRYEEPINTNSTVRPITTQETDHMTTAANVAETTVSRPRKPPPRQDEKDDGGDSNQQLILGKATYVLRK